MPHRSCQATLVNNTEFSLAYDSWRSDLSGGAWLTTALKPPIVIGPGESATFGSESDGFLTGTECRIFYQIVLPPGSPRTPGSVMLWWDVPWGPAPNYDQSCPSDWRLARTGTPPADPHHLVITWNLFDDFLG